MPLCSAQTVGGRRCLNAARPGERYCSKHEDRFDLTAGSVMVAASTVGAALLPGPGLLIGAAAGIIGNHLLKEAEMARKKRVFVSFDFDNDRVLKEFLIGQSRLPDSPFEIIDCSLKEAAPMKTWEDKARRAIKGSDLVIVIVGDRTFKAPGVLKEVAMAREEDIRIIQMIGRKDADYRAVPDAGRLYAWSWENLKKLLS